MPQNNLEWTKKYQKPNILHIGPSIKLKNYKIKIKEPSHHFIKDFHQGAVHGAAWLAEHALNREHPRDIRVKCLKMFNYMMDTQFNERDLRKMKYPDPNIYALPAEHLQHELQRAKSNQKKKSKNKNP